MGDRPTPPDPSRPTGREAPEPVQVVKERRDAALRALVDSVPYIRFLNITFDRRGDELTAVMHYHDDLIGNPVLPALHGGATAAFLEITAIIGLTWSMIWDDLESGTLDPQALAAGRLPSLPKTIDFTVDYLRSGLPRDAYARARLNRSGRRYASVFVEAWQDRKSRPFAHATGHFLLPPLSPAEAAASDPGAVPAAGATGDAAAGPSADRGAGV